MLSIIFLLVCLVSVAIHSMENARQRRRLAVVSGPNQETLTHRRRFFYTVLIMGLLTHAAHYIVGTPTASPRATWTGRRVPSATWPCRGLRSHS